MGINNVTMGRALDKKVCVALYQQVEVDSCADS